MSFNPALLDTLTLYLLGVIFSDQCNIKQSELTAKMGFSWTDTGQSLIQDSSQLWNAYCVTHSTANQGPFHTRHEIKQLSDNKSGFS